MLNYLRYVNNLYHCRIIYQINGMTPEAKKNLKEYSFFIGIDVSKNKLDFAVLAGKQLLVHRVTGNTQDDIQAFISELKSLDGFKIAKAVFTMEQTGYYCNHLLEILRKLKANITVENAVKIKSSLGVLRGKNDKVDAIRIAQFAYTSGTRLTLFMKNFGNLSDRWFCSWSMYLR